MAMKEKGIRILLSYHRHDIEWRDLFANEWKPFQEQGQLDVLDGEVTQSTQIFPRIQVTPGPQLYDIIILLISKKYLSLNDVIDKEIPEKILPLQELGTRVIPVHLDNCPWQSISWLREMKLWPSPQLSFSDMTENEKKKYVSRFIKDELKLGGDEKAKSKYGKGKHGEGPYSGEEGQGGKFKEDEKRCIRIIAKWFRENKRVVNRAEAIKEFGVDDDRYEVLIRVLDNNGVVEKVESNMREGYASHFRPSAYAEELARELDEEDTRSNKGRAYGEGGDEDFRNVFRENLIAFLINEKKFPRESLNHGILAEDPYIDLTVTYPDTDNILAIFNFFKPEINAISFRKPSEILAKVHKVGFVGEYNPFVYTVYPSEESNEDFVILEVEDDGTSNEISYGDFPTYNQLLFASPLSDPGRRICWALTRLAKNKTGLNIYAPCQDYINLQIKKNNRTAAQIHRLNDSDKNIAIVIAGYQKDFPKAKLPTYMLEGEVKKMSGYASKYPGEINWLEGNLGHKQLKYEAGVYILKPGALVLNEIENEVSDLLELAKSNAESKGAGDEGEYNAPIAAFSGDGVRDTEGRLVDQLDIESEVNAMSSLIAARDIKWPLSIGLFGDWGSGKSFFMEMMYDRIKKISGESDRWVEAGNKSDYCRNVVQIRFNAWHYMDSNLWASLVTHIFDELAKEVSSREKVDVEETRKVLFENLESAKKLKDEAEEHEKKAANLKQSAESKLTTVEQERAVAENELKRFTARDVVALAKDDPRIQEQCRQIADKFGLEGIGAKVENIREVVEDAKKIFGGVMLILKRIAAQKNGKLKLIGLTMLLLVLPGLVGLVTFKVLPSGWMEQLGGMALGFVTFLGIHAKTLRPRLKQVSKGLAQWEKVQEQILNIGSETTRAEIELREEIKALKEQENRARQEVEDAEKGVQRAKEELDEIRTGRRLQRLIEEGSRKSEYLEKLGIIAVIRKDFEDLKNLVSESSEQVKSKELPRIDRIILYVDDLDRCPSQRVVEVLQAVHLILGFELFVVVVAVDSRWILHALHEEYSAFGGVDKVTARLGSRWLTTPQNYVEKIFQIPFALRPMGDTGYRQLVGKLVESEERADRESMVEDPEVVTQEGRGSQEKEAEITQGEETEIQKKEPGDKIEGKKDKPDEFEPTIEMKPPSANLSEQEAEFMKEMGDLIPSPRAAKRFVNIYRLTLANVDDRGKLYELRGTENRPGDYQAVLLMLAILTGFPGQGADILKTLANGGGKCNGIMDFVSKLKTRKEPNSEPARYRNGVRKGILEAERVVWDRLSKILKERIKELRVRNSLEPFVRWASWVARFSFQYKPVISEEEGGEEDG